MMIMLDTPFRRRRFYADAAMPYADAAVTIFAASLPPPPLTRHAAVAADTTPMLLMMLLLTMLFITHVLAYNIVYFAYLMLPLSFAAD